MKKNLRLEKGIKLISRWSLRLFGPAISLGLLTLVATLLFNRTNGWVITGGKKRKYLLHVPKTYDPSRPAPLVISIHGYSEWPAHLMQMSRWNELADRHGFLAVYPAGSRFPLQWRIFGKTGSRDDPMRDVSFISDLISKLEKEYNLDPARIYANGMSNGGGMSIVLACRLSTRIAAIGSVAGACLFPLEECQGTRPVPAILFHGTRDPIVPYLGGPSRAFKLPFPSLPGWVESFALHNGCSLPALNLPGRGEVSGVQYLNLAGGADVIFYTVEGGGHTWPGSDPLPDFVAGATTQAINATQLMWDFFQQHPLPSN